MGNIRIVKFPEFRNFDELMFNEYMRHKLFKIQEIKDLYFGLRDYFDGGIYEMVDDEWMYINIQF
jgi:hypothetical protein